MNSDNDMHTPPAWIAEQLATRVVYEGRELFGEIVVWIVDDEDD